MSELRKDPVLNRWVIIAQERGARPHDFAQEPQEEEPAIVCPLCEGNERMTPHEVFAIRDSGEPDKPGWYVRVVPNKFPALMIEGAPDPHEIGLFHHMNGIGAHEIIIENPLHDQDLAFAPREQVIRVLSALRQRIEDLRCDERFRHIIAFRNHGRSAGASLSHPHSQVMALPIIPKIVYELLAGSADYQAANGRCVFCDLIQEEITSGERAILQTDHFVALAPYASRFAFGATIYPRRHCHDMVLMTPEEQADLADMLRRLLISYRAALFNPPYNIVYQTAPSETTDAKSPPSWEAIEQFYHWHIEIMPRLTTFAGFEWGTGFYINPVAPEEAASTLRQNLP